MKLTQSLSILTLGLAVLVSSAYADGDGAKPEKADKATKMQQANLQKAEGLVAKYDANGDGKLSAEELATAMGDKAISIRNANAEKKPAKEKETDHAKEE